MYRILLVDDEDMLLDSLEIILSMKDMEITGKAHDGNEALEILKEKTCDLALVDLNMQGMGGIELIGRIRDEYPGIKILVLTTFYDDKNITDAISRGADGYLLKDSGKESIFGAIEQILNGSSVLDPKVVKRLTMLLSGKNSGEESGNSITCELSDREKEIAYLISEGLNNRQIANKLYISEGTVKNYISNIYDKTGIHDRVKLAMLLK
ncbi:MAG: response regulator transcription factor [Clostridiales bacterium]|nr:response regulator transcription factor [Clostridiales bacterium]